MNLSEYISDMGRRRQLAEDTGTIPDYLWQVATGRRKAGHELAKLIEKKTGGAVTVHDLRPDIFGEAPAQSPKRSLKKAA